MYIFSCEFHTFPVTEGNKIQHIYFQFTTPARKLTHNTKFEHFLDAERHNFREHHNSLLPWAREMPKSNPERHEFRQHHNSLLPWAREMPKSNPERHKFWEHHNSCHLGPENCQNPTRKTRISRKCTH